MIRLNTAFWLLLVVATGFAMYAIKYEVQGLEDDLARTQKAALTEAHEIRVLTAEWAYLNRPEALAEMNQRYLSLVPIATKQLRTSADDIPIRPAPPAEAPAEAPPQIAEAAPTPAPEATPQAAPAALEEPATPAKPAPLKVAARSNAAPPKSLDDLFARVTASR
jgi:hypothetical protein